MNRDVLFLIILILSYFFIILFLSGFYFGFNLIYLFFFLIVLDYEKDHNILKRYGISFENILKNIPIALILLPLWFLVTELVTYGLLAFFGNPNLYTLYKLGSYHNVVVVSCKLLPQKLGYLISHFSILGVFLAIYIIGIATLFEEYIYRGIIMYNLSKYIGDKKANLVQAVFFGLMHTFDVAGPLCLLRLEATILYVVSTIIDGLILGSLAQKRKSIMASWLLHFGFDLTILAYIKPTS